MLCGTKDLLLSKGCRERLIHQTHSFYILDPNSAHGIVTAVIKRNLQFCWTCLHHRHTHILLSLFALR